MLRPVSAGSYGEVWLARNLLTGAYRAIKIIWRDAFETSKPYEREFEAICRFEPMSRTHPGFVHILQTGRLPNGFYYIMELADDLNGFSNIDVPNYEPATLSARKEKLPFEEAIRIGISLSQSIHLLHLGGLIHRDIKPSNVIFVRGEPKLADIGLVAQASEANSIVGTNGFIAPEGPTSHKADIYSLGKLLYEIATGQDRLDFPRLPEVVPVDSLLPELNEILVKACDPDPQVRHSSALAVRNELEFLLQGRSVRRVRQLEKALRWTKAWLVTACALLVSGYVFLQSREAKRTAANQILERRIATAIALGNERFNEGDHLAAFSDFAQAALLDHRNSKEHRLRLGSALAYTPRVLLRLTNDLNSPACYSSASNVLASVVRGRVRLTDLTTSKVIEEFDRGATFLAIAPDGGTLAICQTNVISLIDLASKVDRTIQIPEPIWNLSLVNNGLFAVSTKAGTGYLYPSHIKIPSITNNLNRAILSPSGRFVCLVRDNGTFALLETAGWVERFHAKHETHIYNAMFFPDERTLVTCSFDRTAVAWDVESGQRIGFPMEHEGGIIFTALSPDETHVASGSLDRTVKLWNSPLIGGSHQNHILYHPDVIAWVNFVSDNRVLTHCADGTTWLWAVDWKPQFHVEESRTFEIPEKDRFWSPNTELTASGNVVTGHVGGTSFRAALPGAVSAVAVEPAEQLIAIGTQDDTQNPHAVRLFSRSGRTIGEPLFHKDGITYVTFSHSGALLLSCGEDFTARLWKRRGEMIGTLRHKNQVRWGCFSENDEWVATASWDNTVRLWNTASGTAVTVPLNVGNLVEYVTFRGDNELFIANSRRNYLLSLPLFSGDIDALLRSTPLPNQGDTF